MKRLLHIIVIFISATVFGCAAPNIIQLNKGQDKIDMSAKSLAIATVKISNQHKPGYQPWVTRAHFDANSKEAESAEFSPPWPYIAKAYKEEKGKYNEYLLAFSLKPGSYNFRSIDCYYGHPFVMKALCEIPINGAVEVKANSVTYLGNIEAIIRERKGNEQRAGSLVPFMDQALAGFSTGTFDVVFTDKYEEDMIKFRSEYPALETVKIDKSILPPWIRPEDIKK